VEGAFEMFGPLKETLDGEELEARVTGAVGWGIEARFGGFAAHGPGGFGEAKIDADFSSLALEDAEQVADLGDADVLASLDREDDLFGFGRVGFVEEESAVDAAVGTFLDAFGGAGSAEAKGPILELVLVFEGELLCTGYVGRFADDFLGLADFGAVGVWHSAQLFGSQSWMQSGQSRMNSLSALRWSEADQALRPAARIALFPASKLAAKASSLVRFIGGMLRLPPPHGCAL
jgi:hypothetical protein